MQNDKIGITVAGISAGVVNGLFGAGGGMVLVPLLTKFTDLKDDDLFPASISMILPICLTSLAISSVHTTIPLELALPYLAGSVIGGVLAGFFGTRIPTIWLHKLLGILILWGGVRYLW